MAKQNYIVKFKDEPSRSRFCETVKQQRLVPGENIVVGEALPDLIIYDVSNRELAELRDAAEGEARFIPDEMHDLFASG